MDGEKGRPKPQNDEKMDEVNKILQSIPDDPSASQLLSGSDSTPTPYPTDGGHTRVKEKPKPVDVPRPGPRPPDEGIPEILEWKLDFLIWELEEIRRLLRRLLPLGIVVLIVIPCLALILLFGWLFVGLPGGGLLRPTSTPTATQPAVLSTLTPTATSTSTPTPTFTLTPIAGLIGVTTPTPTSASVVNAPTSTTSPVGTTIRATVLQRANCRYGPGAPFLFKYGVLAGTRLEVIGRTVDGSWLYVQGVGAHNAAWINASLVQMDGNADVMQLPEINPDTGLSVSTFYGPPTITSASSSGGEETIEWSPITVRVDLLPSEGVPLYIVEVWSCKNGKQVYGVYGTNDTTVTFPVETGCTPAPVALIRLQFKEGFSKGEVIPISP